LPRSRRVGNVLLGAAGDTCYKPRMRVLNLRTSSALVITLALAACSKPSEPEAPQSQAAPATTATPAAQPTAPTAHDAKPAPAGTAAAGGLRFRAPAPFVARQPKSSMRAAEFGLDMNGDTSSELAVFYFGADQGGSVEANITRWTGQLKKPDGSAADAKRGERSSHGIAISTVEAEGNYAGGMGMPGAPAPAAIPDAMLLGAIAKGPEGSVFFKLTGPRSNIEAARSAFDQLLESIEH